MTDKEVIKILLIEDNASEALLLREMLGREGIPEFELEWVDSLSAGTEHLAAGRADLLLLNLSLLNGHTLESLVQHHPKNTNLPIVVLTNRDDESLAAKAMHGGAQDYLVKEQISSNLLRRSILYAIERAQVEEALRASEQRYRGLVENLHLGLSLIDRDFTIEFVNTAQAALFGRSPNNFVGQKCYQSFEKRPAPCGHCPGVRAMASGKREEAETEGVREGGGRFKVRVQAYPVFDDRGQATGFVEIIEDITERKQVEEALRESEQLYRSLMDNIDLGVNLIAPNYTILLANTAQARRFDQLPEEFIGKKCYQAFRGRKAPCDDCPGQRAMASRQREECEIERRLGEVQYQARVIAFPIFDGGEQPIGFVEVIEDITGRKKAEAELGQAVLRLKELEAIISRTSAFVFQSRAEAGWPVIFTSDNVRLLGYEPADFTSGRISFAGIVHPEDLSRVEVEIARFTGEGAREFRQEYRIRTRTGEVRWVDDRTWIERDQDGRPLSYQGIMVDITERKWAEEALRESERQFRDVLENVNLLAVTLDLQGKIIFCNDFFLKLTGWRREEMVGQDWFDAIIPEAARELLRSAFKELIPSGNFDQHHENDIITRGGENRTISWSNTPLRDLHGEIIGVTSIGEDITEKEQARQLAKAQRDLALALGISSDLFETLQASLSLVIQAAPGMDCGGIYLLSPQSALKIAVYQGLSKEFISQAAYLPAAAPETQLVLAGQPVYTNYEELAKSQQMTPGKEGLRALAIIPIQGGEGVIACLNVGSHTLEEVPGAARLALEAFASQMGNAIVRKQAEELARAQHKLILQLSATSDLTEAAGACIEAAMAISNTDCGGVYLLDDEGQLNLVASRGLSADFLRHATLYDGDSPNDHLVLEGKPVYCRSLDLRGSHSIALQKEGLRAVAVIPLCNESEIIGCINVGSHSLDSISGASRAVLESFASLISSAISRIRAEHSQRESEHRYRLLAENLKDVVLTISPEGVVTYCSPAITEFGGYRVEEGLGTHIGRYFANSQELAEALELIRQTISEKKGATFEFLYQPKIGVPIPVEVTGKPLVENGRVVALQCVMRDITERKRWEEEIQESFDKLRATVGETVKALAATAEKRDPYTAGHQQRVTRLACAIAQKMHLPAYRIDGIRVAAMVHDIGKICTPIEILNKPGALSDLEMSMIKAHPEVAYEILHTIPFPWPVAQVALQHHERLDGSGYPAGLKADEILLEAKIVAVADVVEAMITHRPFRTARSLQEAQTEISRNRGILYDGEVADAFLELFADGALLKLLDQQTPSEEIG